MCFSGAQSEWAARQFSLWKMIEISEVEYVF